MSGHSLAALAAACGAELRAGASDLTATGVSTLADAGPGEIAFYANPSYRKQLAASRAAAIVVSAADAQLPELAGKALLVAKTPYAAFAKISTVFHPPPAPPAGVDPMARVEPGAQVDESARVEAFAFVGAGATVGKGAVVMAGAYVGQGARIGDGTLLYPRAVVRERCVVGARCILHAGCVIGADGFGFAFDPQGDGRGPMHRKVPQAGIARIEDDVEIGANACVDRATMGETVVGRGSKIDNLVQVGHNVQVGPLSILCSQVGIAGSTTLGAGVVMGGQVGVNGHIHIGDGAKVAARAAIIGDVEPGAVLNGWPAVDGKRWLRSIAVFNRLPELLRDVRQLQKKVAALVGETPPSA